MRKLLLSWAMILVPLMIMAEDNLVLHLDFTKVTDQQVEDLSPSGINAKMMGAAKVEQMGKYAVLNLGNASGYLNMKMKTGEMLSTLDNYSFSLYYRVDDDASLAGNGFFLWTFSTSMNCSASSGRYTIYRLNEQRIALTQSGYANEVGYSVGSASEKGRWMHVVFTQEGTIGKLYIDGALKATLTDLPKNTVNYASEKPSCCWIGKAPFSSDNYLRGTRVTDIRMYSRVLGADEVKAMAAKCEDLDTEFRYGTPGDFVGLEAQVKEAEDFLAQLNVEEYAPNAIVELRDAVKNGREICEAKELSQQIVDRKVEALKAAMALVAASKGYQAKAPTLFTPGTQGFRHPGGLHTEEDFERIKAALANGDTRITTAWNQLCSNEYAQASILTWPTETIIRGGASGQNYMNVARGAAMAYQNALRWKIGGTTDNADAAVRILMAWARGNKYVSGDTNMSLASGIYGYQLAQAAELVRDYEGWKSEEFEEFKRYMMTTWYPVALDFIRRRHDTWRNTANASKGERPGHYWSNWGLCNTLCLMSIGILCDDVHIYNQGVSFYKYDHVGTFADRSSYTQILNDGCNEFIGNLVPVVLPDERGPLGYLGQMQESGRDQGHALMALGLAVDICQVAYNQGDDLFGYMDDRLAAGIEHVAALNFGGVSGSSLPWITYNYADCRGTMGQAWVQDAPNEGGIGGRRPYWDRILGYYEGIRGVKMQYAEKASAAVGIDWGGGNYGQTSGGFDHLGFSTLTAYRPLIEADKAALVLSGDIEYKGVRYVNQTNLGGLKYNYEVCTTKAIPADGEEIKLIPQLPEGVADNGHWRWNTGETTKEITVKADHSYVYRAFYTADNGTISEQSFTIAVAGDCQPDNCAKEITIDGVIRRDTTAHVLAGKGVILYQGNSTGWTNDYLWDNGVKGSSVVVIPNLQTSRTYTCQYTNQGGYVNEAHFHLIVDEAQQRMIVNGTEYEDTETEVLKGSAVTLKLVIPETDNPAQVVWNTGETGNVLALEGIETDRMVTATFRGKDYVFNIKVKANRYSYYDLLTADKGYELVASLSDLRAKAATHYFVLASDDADLLIGLHDAPNNGNKALFYDQPISPLEDVSKLWMMEVDGEAFALRHADYDGLLIQTEWDRPDQMRTHDQPYACEWTKLNFVYEDGAWMVENGKYPGNWLGLWTESHGYQTGEEMACNKTIETRGRLQLFAISRERYQNDYLEGASMMEPKDATLFVINPEFIGNGVGWTMVGTWGNQRFNGAVEVWHSTNFSFSQTIANLPNGTYRVTCQMANGEGSNTGYLYAMSGDAISKDVVKASAVGSNFDAERDKMAADSSYGKLSVEVKVANNALTIGIEEPSAGNTWLVWDNVTLSYLGTEATAICDMSGGRPQTFEKNVFYNLRGQRVEHPTKGLYIVNGKKIVR